MKYIAYLFFGLMLTSCFSKKPELTGKEGKQMPSFSLLLSDSATSFDTKNIPVGKPSVLIYISPFCPYSRAQLEEITNNIEELKNINLLAFTSMPFDAMKIFFGKYQLDKYSNITCGNDKDNYFNSYFQVPGFPYIAIYGKDKKLKQAFVGQTSVRLIREIAEE